MASLGAADPLQEEPEAVQDTEGASTPLQWGAAFLLTHFALRIGRNIDCEDISRTNARIRILAAAESIANLQQTKVEELLQVVAKMHEAKAWAPLLFVEHCVYDETPLEVMVKFAGEDQSHKQIAKTFVVENSWSMLLQDLLPNPGDRGFKSFFRIQGKTSPCIRAAGAATGEAIHKVLRSCEPSSSAIAPRLFEKVVRLVEVDECPANGRAEGILLQERKLQWKHLYSFCIPHKVHAIATKAFPFHEESIRGMIHTSLHLSTAGSFFQLKQALAKLVDERLELLVHDPCDARARSYKALFTKFVPSLRHPRRLAIMNIVMEYFNGNWLLRDTPHHVCAGPSCCPDRETSKKKATSLLEMLLSCLHRGPLCKSNWLGWADTTFFFGWADGLHSLVVDAFQSAFSRATAEGQPSGLQPHDLDLNTGEASHVGGDLVSLLELVAPVDGSGDGPANAQSRWRADNAASLQIARRFMVRGLWQRVFMLKTTLEPQRALMHGLLHSISQEWEHEQLHSHIMDKAKEFRIVNVHQGSLLHNFFVDSMDTLRSKELWGQFHESEIFRTKLLQQTMRPGAVGYQLVFLRTRGFPYKVFSLLEGGENLEAKALDILRTPACMLDSWSRSFLAEHSSVGELTGPRAKAELIVIADVFLGTTFTTERLHSKNLRRARDKQQRRADPFLGSQPHGLERANHMQEEG